MKHLKLLLLATTFIAGASVSALAQDAPPPPPQGEEAAPPAGETPPEQKQDDKKKKREERREERKQERQEQRQQKQEQRQERRQQQEAPPAPAPQEAPPPAAAPQADTPPPPPVEQKAPPPADTPPPPPPQTDKAAPTDQKQERREERREDRREERKQERQDRKGDSPPVPPIPPVPPRGDAPAEPQPPAPQPQPPADTPPPADSGAQKSGAPSQAPAPEAPSVAPAPPPAGEQPAVPPEELKGGASTPEQRQRREERVEREFQQRDRRFDERFGRRIEQRDGRTVIREGDNRVIIRDGGRVIIRNDETERFRRNARDVREERRGNETVTVVRRPNGVEIVTIKDENGNLVRRIRRENGRETVLIDNRRAWERGGRWDRNRGWRHRDRDDGLFIDFYLDLPPVRVDIPRDEYIIDADRGSYEVYEEALEAPPLVETERPYSLQEVTQNVRLRERVRSIDLNTITFATAEWRVADDQVPLLEDIARAMLAVIDENPNAVYLIEGHTDAVGSALDNLSLSDRRAEEVAAILTEHYQIPPENLVTQGYGEDYLRVNTLAANERNRRVTIRNITHLLNVQQSEAQPQ